MDPLDPLNTADPTAPHTSSISGNRYLVRKYEEKPIVGNVIKVLCADEVEEGFQGAWWALVGSDMSDSPLLYPGQKTALIHLRGHRLLPKSGKILLSASPDSVTFARLLALSADSISQLPATEVGELLGLKIYSEVVPAEDSADSTDVVALLSALKTVFPYEEIVLGYYIYTQLGTFPETQAVRPEVTYSAAVAEAIGRLDLVQYRTGVPPEAPVHASADPVPSVPPHSEPQPESLEAQPAAV